MMSREALGRRVREVWVEWASEQSNPKPSWLAPWDELDDGQREVDMRIGEALLAAGRTEFEVDLLECNRALGQAVVDIGCAVGLRPGASVAEIKARIAELMRFTTGSGQVPE